MDPPNKKQLTAWPDWTGQGVSDSPPDRIKAEPLNYFFFSFCLLFFILSYQGSKMELARALCEPTGAGRLI